MSFLSKDAILGMKDEEFEEVEVPEWGDGAKVRIRSLSGAERDRYEASLGKMVKGEMVPDLSNQRARLVALSVVDENGKRLFSDREALQLGGLNAKALNRIYLASAKLSGLSNESVEEAKEDFGGDPSEGSTSD